YNFYESIGFPNEGYGTINVIYNYSNNSFKLESITCNIKKQITNGENSPLQIENIQYNKADLNKKFKYLLKKYNLLH
ncbi:hypothetical protein, partial [Leptospira perdikensis]|uniref:hypothetical protein n=1 Tax=Leptospira perdikensis TaxID=2484948 RepID=UPI001AC0077C